MWRAGNRILDGIREARANTRGETTEKSVERVPVDASLKADPLLDVLRGTTIGLVRSEDTDLSARQLAVFLTCYLTKEKQTVRGLAEKLRVQKPAITRALDRLQSLELLSRE